MHFIGGITEKTVTASYGNPYTGSTPLGYYAETCFLVGEDAHLCGEAVLAMHELAWVNPPSLTVATPPRRRKSLPKWVTPIFRPKGRRTFYERIPCQPLADALCECKYKVLQERLAQAAADAYSRGLLSKSEYVEIIEGIAVS